jgi:transcriptional regulator with XRE-family HTH domain
MENQGLSQTGPTMPAVARTASSAKGPRPSQGARLLKFRQAAGLTQIELGKAIGVPHSNIAHWEWSEKPPRGEVLPLLAQALNVSLEELVGSGAGTRRTADKRPGPIGEMQKTFEAARKLPRKQQRKIIEVVNALVREYGRGGRTA